MPLGEVVNFLVNIHARNISKTAGKKQTSVHSLARNVSETAYTGIFVLHRNEPEVAGWLCGLHPGMFIACLYTRADVL